eukprot:symbB.v1.2.000221.t1/scaffold4.1/size633627/3
MLKRKGLAVGSSRNNTGTKAPERSKSRSSSEGKKPSKKAKDEKKEKEFAWMDSEEEAESPPKATPKRTRSSSEEKPVRVEEVQSLGQMAKLAPKLQKRMKRGDLRSKELCEVVAALGRSKFFDGGLFEVLAIELRRAFNRRSLGPNDVITTIAQLGDLNAYNEGVFEAACDALEREMNRVPEALRQKLEVTLRRVNHVPSEQFRKALSQRSGGRDGRAACPMFWRGQCKWGPKCKLSHDDTSFESTVDSGKWKPPSMSGGKSVGFKQSADLFKDDRCGALW